MSNFVKIIAISDEKKDKNNRTYKSITLESPNVQRYVDESTGEEITVHGRPKRTTINAYERQYLDDAPHYLYNNQIGDIVYGSIVTRSVEPYNIPTKNGVRTVDRYTAFVEEIESSEEFESIVRSTFENEGHPLLFTVKEQNEENEEESVVEQETEEEDDKVPANFSVVGDGAEDDFDSDF